VARLFLQRATIGNEYDDWVSMKVSIRLFFFCICVSGPLLQLARCHAQDDWLTGRDFSRASGKIVGVSWGEPLRKTLNKLAERQRVAIFLDRRVDPSQWVEFTSSGKSVAQTIMALTDQLGLAALQIDKRFYYVGPRDRVAELVFRRQRLMKKVNALPNSMRLKWTAKDRLEIDPLTEPAMLYQELSQKELSQSVRVKMMSAELIEHDLWPKVDLPELTLIDRIIVLTYGFGFWVEVSDKGTACRLVVPEEMQPVEFTHRKKISAADKNRLMDEYPSVKITVSSRATKVVASPMIQYEVKRLLDSANSTTHRQPQGKVVVSLTAEGRIIAILEKVAAEHNVQLKFDSDLAAILEKRVKLEVKQVTYDQLIQKTLESTGLKYQWTDGELLITR